MPYWYTAWMLKAMLEQDSTERYDEIFNEAAQKYPDYTGYYFLKAWHRQERWYGSHDEWQAFAQQSADRLGGEKGDVLYARIIWYVRELHIYDDPIAETDVDWPRVQRGFEAIRKAYPDSLLALSEYCSLARYAPELSAPLLRRLFFEIGDRVDLAIWTSTDQFVRTRGWAFSH